MDHTHEVTGSIPVSPSLRLPLAANEDCPGARSQILDHKSLIIRPSQSEPPISQEDTITAADLTVPAASVRIRMEFNAEYC